MKFFKDEYLRKVCTDIFISYGSPADEAAIVADELVESDLMGFASHGIMRCIDYADNVKAGRVKPGAPMRVVKESPTTAIVDCGLNFGQVSAKRITDIACDKAKKCGIAYIITKNCFHVGRLGSWTQKVAERGMFGLATANNRKVGHIVAPWGGREGRLGTNPMAFAAPTQGWPVVLDMTTCMIAGGKLAMLIHEGKQAPPGCIQDSDGNATTDPNVITGLKLVRDAPTGTILPFGAPGYGYKGYGLSMMVEIMGGIMAGEDATDDQPGANGFAIIAIDPDAFCGAELFTDLVDKICAYQMSSEPAVGYNEVVVPGLYEFRTREKRLAEGVPIDDNVWQKITEVASTYGVNIAKE